MKRKRGKDYLPNLSFIQAAVLVGTLGDSITLNSIDQDDNAWVIMWRTHSRPLGVKVLPVSTGFFLCELQCS